MSAGETSRSEICRIERSERPRTRTTDESCTGPRWPMSQVALAPTVSEPLSRKPTVPCSFGNRRDRPPREDRSRRGSRACRRRGSSTRRPERDARIGRRARDLHVDRIRRQELQLDATRLLTELVFPCGRASCFPDVHRGANRETRRALRANRSSCRRRRPRSGDRRSSRTWRRGRPRASRSATSSPRCRRRRPCSCRRVFPAGRAAPRSARRRTSLR